MRNWTIRIFALTLLMAAMALVEAQAKTDFSGTWKADISKCDFGPMPPPDSIVEKIVHEDPSLKVNIAQTGGDQGDVAYDMAYTTDGKESVNHMGENEFRTTLQWDGDDLVGDTKGTYGGFNFTSKDRWTLSDGGKTITVARHISTDSGDIDMKFVFVKQ
jgi:hypothetical protein